MTDTRRTHDLGILIRTERRDGYFHVIGDIVTADGGKIRNTASNYDSDYRPLGLDIDGLQLRSQGTDDRETRDLYGFEVCYRERFHVDTGDAKAMYATLATIDRKMGKLYETRAAVQSYGEFVGRIAECLGHHCSIIEQRGVRRPGGWSHDDCDYVFHSIGDGVRYVTNLIWRWQQERETDQTAQTA